MAKPTLPELPDLPVTSPMKDTGGRNKYKPDVPDVGVVRSLTLVFFKDPISVEGVPKTFVQSKDHKILQLSDRTIQISTVRVAKKTLVPFENVASFQFE